jgi:hypothetical protein
MGSSENIHIVDFKVFSYATLYSKDYYRSNIVCSFFNSEMFQQLTGFGPTVIYNVLVTGSNDYFA